jgi:hypothetical protein
VVAAAAAACENLLRRMHSSIIGRVDLKLIYLFPVRPVMSGKNNKFSPRINYEKHLSSEPLLKKKLKPLLLYGRKKSD